MCFLIPLVNVYMRLKSVEGKQCLNGAVNALFAEDMLIHTVCHVAQEKSTRAAIFWGAWHQRFQKVVSCSFHVYANGAVFKSLHCQCPKTLLSCKRMAKTKKFSASQSDVFLKLLGRNKKLYRWLNRWHFLGLGKMNEKSNHIDIDIIIIIIELWLHSSFLTLLRCLLKPQMQTFVRFICLYLTVGENLRLPFAFHWILR